MNAEHILNALGDVRADYIADADRPVPRRRPQPIRRLAVLAAVLALCLALAIPAAAYTDAGYTILYALSPAAAQALKPVNESCETNGVRMEVQESALDGDTAWFRIAMTDTTGDLFDGPIDLYDSYQINRGFDAAGSCRQEEYDADAHTAVFLVQLGTMDGSSIAPGKVTFRVRELYAHSQLWEQAIAGVDLSAAAADPETIPFTDPDAAHGYEISSPDNTLAYDCLVPDTPVEICPGAAITGLGWVDGKLHVQVREQVGQDLNTTGVVELLDKNGEPLYSGYECFYDLENHVRYDEYAFAVTPEDVSSHTLTGHFSILDGYLEGPWEVTFPLA